MRSLETLSLRFEVARIQKRNQKQLYYNKTVFNAESIELKHAPPICFILTNDLCEQKF